ncbi:HNH endonuclease [Agromyces endophyticus]|uniref:HNH endonuclease signature motif containing protein n=1 Tax=Agromyces sp. H17E-10 TaxID=2932244 RepID=UPI001FD22CCD|nr:HNH endonuclease signature motif containing protein [Agromyces sp. H17E-10]UOQ87672.1 HNH endonuclease [Agromyces sp. H17E-10]
MADLSAALEHLEVLLADVFAATSPAALRDDDLLLATAALERFGRLVDAGRAAFAGEIAERSDRNHGAERLSAKKGCRSAVELLERVTQVSGVEARRRITVGAATRARGGLTGEPLPPEHSHVASALAEGALGLDAAITIVRELARTRAVADPVRLEVAERELVDAALGRGEAAPIRCTADEVAVQARAWAAFLDQDGPEPDDERAMRKRGFRLGRARDGLITVSGELMPEIAAKLRRLLDAHLAPRSDTLTFTPTDGAGLPDHSRPGDDGFAAQAARTDPRTADQHRHDVLAAIIDTAARSGEHPSIGGAAPTVLVSVRATDLQHGRGSAHADGVDTPISLRAARHMMCTGGVQTVVFDDAGRIIRLGSPERCFTPHQRRAITLRDGNCVIPGCTVPAAWAEIHHVIPDHRGGPTHPDNGVLLCWFHHRTIDTSGWTIRMRLGTPEVRAPHWLDPTGTWRRSTTSPTRLADRRERRDTG